MAYHSNSICDPLDVRCLLCGMKTANMVKGSPTPSTPHQVKLFEAISNGAKRQQAICCGTWCSELPRDGRNAVLFFQFCFPSDLNCYLSLFIVSKCD